MDGGNPRLTGLRHLPLLHILLLAGMSGALFLTHLSCPLLEPEEARYAEIPRQMLAEGRIIEPVLHGEPYYQKPPLLYWLVMLSYSIFGVHDWAARLVPVLASLGTVFITWWWARRVFGSQIGFWAAAVLILSARFVYLGRMLTIDPLLTLWVTGGLVTAHLAVREGSLKWRGWLASAALTGLGLLTKGPVAVVLTVVPVVAFQFLDRSSSRPSLRGLVCYLLLALTVASPWYVAMALTNPEAAVDFFWVHNLQRFVDPLDHEEPWWFFLPSLLLGTLPWSLVGLLAVLRVYTGVGGCDAERRGSAFPRRAWERDTGNLFALIAFCWCMLFFSVSGCKRAVYILPAFPWLAVCLGYYVTKTPWRELPYLPRYVTWKYCGALVFILLFIGAFWLLPIYHDVYGLRGQVCQQFDTDVEVFCYPKRWDSISYYLQRDDVRVFSADQLSTMISTLQERPGALLFVRDGNYKELLAALPKSLAFVEVGPRSNRLKVGIVKPRLVIDGRGEESGSMDTTTDPGLRSWVPVTPDSHFPIQNLPYGVFCRGDNDPPEIGVAIGAMVLSVSDLAKLGFFDDVIAFGGRFWFAQQTSLNGFMKCGKELWRPIRERISQLLQHDNHRIRDKAELRKQCLLPQASVRMLLPVDIHNYTDFYSLCEHATNVGIMMRGPQNALQPNWLHLPVAYHGRASSIVISGTDLHRPSGQTKADDAPSPSFGPSRNVDFELEMGFFVGPGNELGRPISVSDANDHIFGMVLVNDWSARDIQKWEYVPLGPFLAKNFGTSISPWVVTLDAFEPFRCLGPVQDPQPLPYLQTSGAQAYDINLEVQLQTPKMDRPHRICASNAKNLYWNIAQQLAHHTVNGCNMQSGDLLASGTISGPTPDSFGSMLELAWKGTKPLQLPSGETRTFLEDGDRVTMTAWCQGQGYRVGFGEVTGKILPPT